MSMFGYVSIFPQIYLDEEPLGYLVAVSANAPTDWASTYYATANAARDAAVTLAEKHGLFLSDASKLEPTLIISGRTGVRHD